MLRLIFFVLTLGLVSCNSSTVENAVDDFEDAVDLAEGVERKAIDTSRLGTNAFVNDQRFGSIEAQMNEVRNVLGISYVRVLFAWSDGVQPAPGSGLNFSFYDDILAALPPGTDALVVVTGLPSWMSDPANWIDGDPRKTFLQKWFNPVVKRYGRRRTIVGWQVWNEPNMTANPENTVMGFADSPENYVDLLARANNTVRELSPGKLVLNAATTAINQNYPDSLNYNKRMRDAGAEEFVDRWAIHVYGRQFENFLRSNGIVDFLNELSDPIWVTESGAQGTNNQLAYGEQVWPFLVDNIPTIQRIYQYQFTEATSADSTYGLKNLSSDRPVSDLYVFLRDRNK